MRRTFLALILCVGCVGFATQAQAQAREPCVLGRDMPHRIPVSGVIFVGLLDPQCFGLFQDGLLVRFDRKQLFFGWMSSGAEGMETPVTSPYPDGLHRIYEKKRRTYSRDRETRGTLMEYAWRFNDERGFWIHKGEVEIPFASHGCVRIPDWAAKALFFRFQQDQLSVVIAYDKNHLLGRWE